ncbi:hypothetical protein Hanom_Chr12g01090511 [Helianthus anomalus]
MEHNNLHAYICCLLDPTINLNLGCVPELKIPPHLSPPLHVFPNWKDYYQAKKTTFSLSSPPPVKWISGTQH